MSISPGPVNSDTQAQHADLLYKLRWFLDRDEAIHNGPPSGRRRHALATEIAEWINEHYYPKTRSTTDAPRIVNAPQHDETAPQAVEDTLAGINQEVS